MESRRFWIFFFFIIFCPQVFGATQLQQNKTSILVPHTDEDARELFAKNKPKDKNLSIKENTNPKSIDNYFWRTDSLGNTYYIVSDNYTGKYFILRLNHQTKEYALFDSETVAVENQGSAKSYSCKIQHFDVSSDGRFIFMELFYADKINQIVCVETGYGNGSNRSGGDLQKTILLNQKSVGWNVSSLVYSSASGKLYYNTYPPQQMINGYPVYYDIGLYIFSKHDGVFQAGTYERAFNLPQWIILDAYKAFIEKGSAGQSLIAQGSSGLEPDYKGFLEWIRYFADKVDCDFFIKADDGQILTGVYALKYSLEKKKFGFTGKYLEDSVCKIENGKITGNTAFSIINNNAMFVEPNEQRVSPVWLARNDDGIWFFMEEAVTYKDAAGKTQWKNGWYNPVLVEDNEGNSVLARYNPLGKKIKATDDDTIATIKINSGKLIYKNYEDDKYFLYADSENIECKSLVDAVAKAKKFVEEKVEQQELVELVISNTAEDSVTQTETELKINDELDVQTDNLSPQTESSNLDLVVLDEPNVTSDSVPTVEPSQNKNQLLIIIFSLVLFLCVVELAIIFIILSKKFNQHLSKKDKKFIFKIQEDERSKLSRDIHDSVVQNIRAIRLDTEMLNVVPESETKKQRIIEEMTNVISLLRNICYNFRPAELSVQNENTELISIIDTLCQQFIARTKIPCHIQIQKDFVPPKMDTEKSTNIVRVIQEALANIEKHSYATNVQVVIQSEGEDTKTLVIFIIDDGIGCEVCKLGKSKMNFGIRNMRDRIAAAGGEIEFFSVPDEGLSVQLRIPY